MSIARMTLSSLLFGMTALAQSTDAILGKWNCTFVERTLVPTGAAIRTLQHKNIILELKPDKTANYLEAIGHWSGDAKKLTIETDTLARISGKLDKQTLKMKGSEPGPQRETIIATEWTCKRP